jgi:glyoxylate/hydroxypyruvate reductase
MNKRILVTRKLTPETLEPLHKMYDVDVWESEDEVMPREQLLERVEGVSGILCMLTDKIDTELLDTAGDQLRVVSTMSVGYDHIDAEELKKRDIELGTTPGVLDDSIADLTIALMLDASRRIPEAIAAAKNGE